MAPASAGVFSNINSAGIEVVKLKAPEGSTGCSHSGIEYEAIGGIVEVPEEAVADLLPHGYTVAPAAPEKKK